VYIRKTTKSHKGKTYDNYLLVESVSTPKGPRQKIICSLGSLAPAPREHWLQLAHRVESSLSGQGSLQPTEAAVEAVVEKGQRRSKRRPGVTSTQADALVVVDTERVSTENPREAGPLHVGHQVWRQLRLPEILRGVGLSERAVLLSEAMALNRLIFPLSEHAMPDWIRNTAMAEILGTDFSPLNDEALYRNLDRLHPQREAIERELGEREKTLFNLEDTVYLYDLTSTYFEGEMVDNPQAKRGYSRDKRPDCKQVLVGLVLDRHGFPKAHEVFEGNRQDRTTVKEMLESLEKRVGKKTTATVVIDRGMAYEENLKEIRDHGYHYLVACRQSERNAWLADWEKGDGWEEVLRSRSPRNPGQKKSPVWIKRRQKGNELYMLCRSAGREEKDRAIRERQQERWLKDLNALKARIENGHLQNAEKIHEAIGRLKERYPRVARYYEANYDAAQKSLSWQERVDKKAIAEKLDGSYLLKSDRQDWTDFPRIWAPTPENRDLRQLILHRHRLVGMRTRVMNQLQAVAMNEGIRCKKGLWTAKGRKQLESLSLLPWTSRPRQELLELLDQFDPNVEKLSQAIEQEAEQIPEVKLLMTHPGVGAITALAFVLVIGTPERFGCGKQVASYLGLIPCEDSSSERWRLGHITKQGNALLRFLLGQAAQSVARCEEPWQQQYAHLKMRRNKSIAKVAMARKLAVRLFWMWRKE
jgi:transposase